MAAHHCWTIGCAAFLCFVVSIFKRPFCTLYYEYSFIVLNLLAVFGETPHSESDSVPWPFLNNLCCRGSQISKNLPFLAKFS